MRADRLLSELMWLQARGRMTARQLAQELEVTERTIYRDVEALSFAGIPVYTERGPGGGISLLESYRTTLTGLKRDEARALFMLNIPAALASLGVEDELRAAFLKLAAALPLALREEEQRVRQRFYLDPVTDVSRPTGPPHLAALQRAVWEDRKLLVRYRSILGDLVEPLQEVLEPYGLVAWSGEWHLVAARVQGYQVMRADRILETRLLEERFQRPEDFDLASFWKSWQAEHGLPRRNFCVKARVRREVLPALAAHLDGHTLARTAPESSEPWIFLDLRFEFLSEARERLLPLGGAVEVLQPKALRLSMVDYARQIASRYQQELAES